MMQRPHSLPWAIAILAGLHLSLMAPSAQDWPFWRGPFRNGISPETGLSPTWPAEGPKVLWKAALGKGFSSLTISRGQVYSLGNHEGTDTLYCLDAETGRGLWKHSYPCPLDPKSFEGGPLATPVVDGDRVYSLSKFGDGFCLDACTGKVLWSRKFTPPSLTKADYHVWWGFAGSIVVLPDRLVLPVGTAGMSVDKLTGDVLWDNGPGHPGYSTPVLFDLAGKQHFAFVSGHQVVAADVQTGRTLWTIPWKTTWDQNASDVIISDSRLFVSTGHGVGCALFDISGEKPVQIWRNKNMRTFLSSCLLWKGYLYGFDDRQLRCLDWKTGEVRWSVPDLDLGSLILAEGKLIALTEKGTLLLVEAAPEAYRPVSQAQILGGRCWSPPALADGRLYIRNAAGDAVCVSLKNDPDK